MEIRQLQRKPRKDLTGKVFSNLTVIEIVGVIAREGNILYRCKCVCGEHVNVRGTILTQGKTKSCVRCSHIRNLVGQKFSRLLVLEYIKEIKIVATFLCLCDCGEIKQIRGASLSQGKTKSCGCLQRETAVALTKGENNYFFNHNLTEEDRELRSKLGRGKRSILKGYNQWRREVRKRDCNKCKICKSEEKLVVHHLNNFTNFPLERISLENGVTLCENCHYNFHKKYTNFNNTKIQFEEWMTQL